MTRPSSRKRSLARGLALALLAVAPLGLTGCDTQKLGQFLGVVNQLLPVLASMSGSSPSTGLTPPSFSSLSSGIPGGTFTPMPGANMSGVGTPNPSLSGGVPTVDSTGSGPPPTTGNTSRDEIGRLLYAAAQRHNIPPDYLYAVAWQESTWNPNLSSFDGGHGKGVMQIDDRFHEFARTPQVWDPAANIEYGARFLREKYDQTGDWTQAFQRYNGGSDYPPLIWAHVRNRPWAQPA